MDLFNDNTKVSQRLVKKALKRGDIGMWYTSSWGYYDLEIAETKFIPIVINLTRKRGVKELIGEKPLEYRYTWEYGNSTIQLDETTYSYFIRIRSKD